MCFSPPVSLTTAIIEFLLALILLWRFKKSVVTVFTALLLFFLGGYQFAEFMFCVSGNTVLWASIGFISYTFLPAVGLHYMISLHKPRKHKMLVFLLYIPTAISVALPIFIKNFIIGGVCNTFTITVHNRFFQEHPLFSFLYILYYFGYIIMACILMERYYKGEKDKIKKKVYGYVLAGMLIITVPALILLVIMPSLKMVFPSMYCHFALAFGIMAFMSAMVYEQQKSKKESS